MTLHNIDRGFRQKTQGTLQSIGHGFVGGQYRANAVTFDGANDYLRRVAGLTGAADSKFLTASFWIKKAGDGVAQCVFAGADLAGVNTQTRIFTLTTDSVSVLAEDTGGTLRLNVASSNDSIEAADGWVHFMCSFDMADTGKRHIYINDVSDLAVVTTYTNATLDHTSADWAVGARPGATDKLAADLADLMVWTNLYVDLSVEANRRLFISAWGKPINPAAAVAVLGAPIIGLYGPISAWHTNKGGGGGFTLTGTLTDAASPSD